MLGKLYPGNETSREQAPHFLQQNATAHHYAVITRTSEAAALAARNPARDQPCRSFQQECLDFLGF